MEEINITPDASGPPPVAEYEIDGKKYSVTRYFCGVKEKEELMSELAYRQAGRQGI